MYMLHLNEYFHYTVVFIDLELKYFHYTVEFIDLELRERDLGDIQKYSRVCRERTEGWEQSP